MAIHIPPPIPMSDEQDKIDFAGILKELYSAKRFIFSVTVLSALTALLYVLFNSASYKSSVLVQLEQPSNVSNIVVGGLGSRIGIQTSAISEIEIIKSPLILKKSINDFLLDVQITESDTSFSKKWIKPDSKIAYLLEAAGIYTATPQDTIVFLEALALPKSLRNRKLALIKTQNGYQLISPEQTIITEGKFEELVNFNYNGESGQIYISDIKAEEDAWFTLKQESLEQALLRLQKNLIVEEEPSGSRIIDISYVSSNKEIAVKTTNAVGQTYLEIDSEKKKTEATESLDYLNMFLPKLKNQIIDLKKTNKLPSNQEISEQANSFQLSNELKFDSELYSNLLLVSQQLKLIRDGKSGMTRLIDRSFISSEKITSKDPILVGIGLFLGFILSITLVLFRNFYRGEIRSTATLEKKIGRKVYALIPFGKRKKQIPEEYNKENATTNAIDRLSIQIKNNSDQGKKNIIIFTGLYESKQRLFVARNLAKSLFSKKNKSILIDCDFNNKIISKKLASDENCFGIYECIEDKISVENVIYMKPDIRADFIPVGNRKILSAEDILQSNEFNNLLSELSTKYDNIVVNIAPIFIENDALQLASKDYLFFLYIRSKSDTLEDSAEGIRRLEQAGANKINIILEE
ncbi:GNVR domain-containing protein [Alcaligenes sp. SDU_A2]|uniref:GNVR domain-containing protein n=1 Tax=Alcaligenes sp. SDU_A2 TaxID=3136634 RepID=UPI00311ECE78